MSVWTRLVAMWCTKRAEDFRRDARKVRKATPHPVTEFAQLRVRFADALEECAEVMEATGAEIRGEP